MKPKKYFRVDDYSFADNLAGITEDYLWEPLSDSLAESLSDSMAGSLPLGLWEDLWVSLESEDSYYEA